MIGIVALLVKVNRQPLALGLCVTVLGDVVSVALLNGYLIGALWLVIGIAFAEWQAERSGLRKSGLTVSPGWRKAAIGLMLALALLHVTLYGIHLATRTFLQGQTLPRIAR